MVVAALQVPVFVFSQFGEGLLAVGLVLQFHAQPLALQQAVFWSPAHPVAANCFCAGDPAWVQPVMAPSIIMRGPSLGHSFMKNSFMRCRSSRLSIHRMRKRKLAASFFTDEPLEGFELVFAPCPNLLFALPN